MDLKSKLILKTEHWPLLYKALFLAVVWWFFPVFVFIPAASALYVLGSFRRSKLPIVYLSMILLAVNPGVSVWPKILAAVVLGSGIYLFFGIRELVFVNRFEAAKILLLLIAISGAYETAVFTNHWTGWIPTVIPWFLGLWFFGLIADIWSVLKPEDVNWPGLDSSNGTKIFLFGGLSGLILAETAAITTILPLPAAYRGALTVLPVFLALDLFLPKHKGDLSGRNLWISVSVAAVILAVILFSAPFGLDKIGFYR